MPTKNNGDQGVSRGTMMKFFGKVLQGLIRAYQLILLPVLPAGSCRFHPTCSAYAMDAIGGHGPITGVWLAIKRISRCHPWGEAGTDPVPLVKGHNRKGAGLIQ